jgi:hypothetical protein
MVQVKAQVGDLALAENRVAYFTGSRVKIIRDNSIGMPIDRSGKTTRGKAAINNMCMEKTVFIVA